MNKILICGTSAWLTGIAEGLNTVEGFTAQCVNPRLLKTADRVAVLAPNVIVVERGTWDWTLLRLAPDYPIIEIDAAQSRLRIRNTHEITVTSITDLVHIIEELT